MRKARGGPEPPPGARPTGRDEAAAIYAALFASEAPASVIQRYTAALATLPLEPVPEAIDALWSDPPRLAAVEYFLRLTQGRNGLSQRFGILLYLSELEPQLFSRFARDRASLRAGLVDLARVSWSAPLAYARGLAWWRRHARA